MEAEKGKREVLLEIAEIAWLFRNDQIVFHEVVKLPSSSLQLPFHFKSLTLSNSKLGYILLFLFKLI